ncbi:MAG: hypothetical protein WBB67_05900 [bacterium]
MSFKQICAYISGIIAIVSFILAVIARLIYADKIFLGLSALAYLRITNTMLLFAVAFMFLKLLERKG